MQTNVQELTDKIYNEGVDKARKQADAILKEAKAKAAAIEQEAQKTADELVKTAQEKAETLKQHVESELKMTVSQSISALKQELINQVTLKAVQPGIKELFSNVEYLKVLIQKIVGVWAEKDTLDMKIVISEKDYKEMETFFKNQLADELNKGLELSFSDNIKSGFKVGPSQGGYLISFSDQDFTNFFKTYLRPKTSELLFEENK